MSIVILTYDSLPLVLQCLGDLKHLNYPHYEIILIDNGSRDEIAEIIRTSYPDISILKNHANLGYAGGNNCALKIASGDYLLFLNDDSYLSSNSLWHLVHMAASSPNIAIVASKIYKGRSDIIESAGAMIEYPLGFGPGRGMNRRDFGQFDYVAEVGYASGAAFFVKKNVFEELEGFDATYFCYHEELDFCWRARLKGYETVFCPSSSVAHLGSQTSGRVLNEIRYITLNFRNRIITNIKNLSRRRLATSLFYEVAQAVLVFAGAIFLSKARKCCFAMFIAFLSIMSNLKAILEVRLSIQASRTKNDHYILKHHTRVSFYSHMRNNFLKWR